MRPALVIFDCDGVLVDSEPLVNRVFAEMLIEVGFPIDSAAMLREFVGVAMTTRVATLRERLSWIPAADFLERFHERLRDLVSRELRPVTGIEAVLRALDVPFCVASNGNPEEIRFRLDAAGLEMLVPGPLFSATDVARPKPAPDLFLHAARTMGVAPERCTVVEDSAPGIRAAIAAGMRVISYAGHADPDVQRSLGAIPIASMTLLLGLLENPA